MSRENVELVRAIYDEWGEGNLRAGLDLYDPHILFIPREDVPAARRYIGPEGIEEFTREWLKVWTDFTIAAEDFIDAGGSVVVAVRQRGVGRESGVAAELPYFQVWTFRGRAVIRIEQFRDRAEALEAVGLRE